MGRLSLALLAAAALQSATAAGAAQQIAAAAIHDAVARFVAAAVADQLDSDQRVETRTRWRTPLEVDAAGPLQLEVRRLSARPLSGPTVLRLGVRAGDLVVSEVSVTADVRWFRPVVVAGRGLQRGEALDPAHLAVEERDVTQSRGQPFTDPAAVTGLRLCRGLQAGQVLTDQYTEAIPVVARGASVRLVVENAHLQLSAAAVALQDGGPGERIRVRNVDSGAVVYGCVVDAATVAAELP